MCEYTLPAQHFWIEVVGAGAAANCKLAVFVLLGAFWCGV